MDVNARLQKIAAAIEGYRSAAKKHRVPPLSQWNMAAGGTSVPEKYKSYDIRVGDVRYSIDPIGQGGRFVGYRLTAFPGQRHGHTGIDRSGFEVNMLSQACMFRRADTAVVAARRHAGEEP